MSTGFWRDRRVLVTGHTGFKGAWLTTWLGALGAQASGLALAPDTDPSLAVLLRGATGGDPASIGDVRDLDTVRAAYERHRPEIVFHLGAQSLVRRGYRDPVGTYSTNVLGTANVLEAARGRDELVAVLVVTSDKVYAHRASGEAYEEDAPLGGADPYSSSKAAAELVTAACRRSFLVAEGVAVATARAGNVIGGGDWAEDRLVPDVLRARSAGTPVRLRFPDAERPWQHVLDPLHGYLAFAERLVTDPGAAPEALNFGPAAGDGCTVAELVGQLSARFGGAPGWEPTLELDLDQPETAVLRLSSARATEALGWKPGLTLDDAVAWTAEWHLAHERGDDMRAVCIAQIEAFERLAS